MPRSLVVLSALALAFCLAAGAAGCGGSPPATPSGKITQPAQEHNPQPEPKPQAQSSQAEAWPEWSGPKSLGPGKALPELWYVEFVHFPEAGSLHCYRLSVTSEGEYGDAVNTKGQLAAEELAAVKAVLEKVDWEQAPQSKNKDYLAYTASPKSWPPLPDISYYELKIWLGQTHGSPPYEGRTIIADLKAPCAPEVKEAIDVLKPLQEKYQPELH